MKVLQILGDPTGGIRKHVHELIAFCHRLAYEVHYAHGDTLDLVGNKEIGIFDSIGVKRIALRIPKGPQPLDLKNILLLVRYCRRHKIDILHGHGAKGGLYSRLVGLIAGLPSVYTPHGGSIHSRYGYFEGLLYRSVERILKPFTTLFLFESNYTYDRFIAATGALEKHRFRINHNGIDSATFSPIRHWSDDSATLVNILVVGVLRDVKGQAIAVHALEKLRHTKEWNFRLHFCGDGPDREKLELLIEAYQLSDRVFFYGEVEDIAKWYEMCSIVVIPSLFESFGYVAVEAALMRRPVVAADVGGLPEIIVNNETGRLFPGGDSDALAMQILNALQDLARTDDLVVSAEKLVREKFRLDTMLQNIKMAYESVLSNSRRT